jgi:hypothetical protein
MMVARADKLVHGPAFGMAMDARMIKFLPLAVLLASCSEEEVRTYQVASEEVRSSKVDTPAVPKAPGEQSVVWQVPDGWTEVAPGQFQLAAYQLGAGLSATVSMLPGDAGGVAANVNRWRGQVGLDPLGASEIKGEEVAGYKGVGDLKYYELLGKPGSDPASGILAGILRLSNETWFFKLAGPVSGLSETRQVFMGFLEALETKAGAGPAPAEKKAEEPQKPKIDFKVPEGWTVGPEGQMRVATFRAAGEDGYEADISVVPLPGDAGSVMDNVNRWRAQLQLEPLTDENDPAVGSIIEGAPGKILITHMKSSVPLFDEKFHGAISAAIVPGSKYTWFLKMSGEARVVEANRSRFEEFVKSVRFP